MFFFFLKEFTCIYIFLSHAGIFLVNLTIQTYVSWYNNHYYYFNYSFDINNCQCELHCITCILY